MADARVSCVDMGLARRWYFKGSARSKSVDTLMNVCFLAEVFLRCFHDHVILSNDGLFRWSVDLVYVRYHVHARVRYGDGACAFGETECYRHVCCV